MASFTLLPLEILASIREHLVKPSDILTLTTLNRETSTYIKLFLYSTITSTMRNPLTRAPATRKATSSCPTITRLKERVLKLQTTLQHKPSFGSRITTLDIYLHTGATCITGGDEIYTLLPHLHHLKHFRLIVEILNDQAFSPARDKVSPARLAIALKDSTCKTLETLELVLGRDCSHTDETALGDLNSFVALKELSAQSYVLLGGYDVDRFDHNHINEIMPMLSEILPANLEHLRIHCGGAKVSNAVNCSNHERRDKDEALAHLTTPVNWGPKERGSCEGSIMPVELEHANKVRVLKNVRKCFCYGDFWTMMSELVRLSHRLDVVGEDDNPSPRSSTGLADS